MGLSLKSIGKSISKAFKSVGKVLQKAAPVLIPLAVTGGLGSLGGLAGSGGLLSKASSALLGGSNLGAIGQNLLGKLGGGLIGSAVGEKGGSDLVDPAAAAGGGDGLVSKFLPTLMTELLEGKPKSASKEAAALYSNAPTMTPAQADIANYLGGELKNAVANQEKVSPLSTSSRAPLTFGAPMQPGAPGPLAPVSFTGTQTGGDIGTFAAPVSFNPAQNASTRPRGFAVRRRA